MERQADGGFSAAELQLLRPQRWLRIGFAGLTPKSLDHVLVDLDLKLLSGQLGTVVIPLSTAKLAQDTGRPELDLRLRIIVEVKRP